MYPIFWLRARVPLFIYILKFPRIRGQFAKEDREELVRGGIRAGGLRWVGKARPTMQGVRHHIPYEYRIFEMIFDGWESGNYATQLNDMWMPFTVVNPLLYHSVKPGVHQ